MKYYERTGDKMYTVILNHEKQYCLWPASEEIPASWKSEGMLGSKEECVAHIVERLRSLRPRSSRKISVNK